MRWIASFAELSRACSPRVRPCAAWQSALSRACRDGFSLVELLVVVGIIGVLTSLLLPAVQQARESGRRSACANNLRASATAVLNYESARRTLPPGTDMVPRQPDLSGGTLFAWSAFVLPYVEHNALAARFDYSKAWDAPGGNAAAAATWIGSYVCPSGRMRSVGKADYGGVAGNVIVFEGAFVGRVGINNGLLVPIDASRPQPVRTAEATDGLAKTLMVGESVDRCAEDSPAEGFTCSRWAYANYFAQSMAYITLPGSDIHSHHQGGANVAYGDGRVTLLGGAVDPAVLAALCTRNGGEALASSVAMQ